MINSVFPLNLDDVGGKVTADLHSDIKWCEYSTNTESVVAFCVSDPTH